MEQFWQNSAKNDLYSPWFGGIARGLFWEGGLYNSALMDAFFAKEFANTTIQRQVDIGIVDVVDGSYKDISHENITNGVDLVDALYASMSYAGFFPPAEVFGS